jgi:metal-responsive CopG/Arc/MetJ family transcriptional regulator
MPKKVLIALPPALLAQVDYVAEAEHRTRSDLMREALRRYVASFRPTEVASCVPMAPRQSSGVALVASDRTQLEQAWHSREVIR